MKGNRIIPKILSVVLCSQLMISWNQSMHQDWSISVGCSPLNFMAPKIAWTEFTAFHFLTETSGTALRVHKTCKNLLIQRPPPFCEVSEVGSRCSTYFALGFYKVQWVGIESYRSMAYKAKQLVTPGFVCRHKRTYWGSTER